MSKMVEKELKRLKKVDLLELLISQSRENEQLKEQLEQAQAQLAKRQLDLEQTGSIAEAALQVSGIFQVAQDAADQYLENIRQRSERQDEICAQRDQASQEQADRLLAETKAKCKAMEDEIKAKCQHLIEEAAQKAKECWADLSEQTEHMLDARKELQALLDCRAGLNINDEEE